MLKARQKAGLSQADVAKRMGNKRAGSYTAGVFVREWQALAIAGYATEICQCGRVSVASQVRAPVMKPAHNKAPKSDRSRLKQGAKATPAHFGR